MVDLKRFNELLQLYKNNLISTEEWDELRILIKSGGFEKELDDDFLTSLHNQDLPNKWDSRLELKMWLEIEARISERKIRLNYKWIAVAATILIVLGIGLWFFNTPRHPDAGQDPGHDVFANDIAPGTNNATLTLSNGKILTLSGAKTGVVIDASKLTYNDGTKVGDSFISGRHPEVTRHPELVSGSRTITTPRGGTYQVILSDGTHIWLNAASSLKFPATFASLKERKVELIGEAYFIVKHNAKQPFRVETKGQIVEDIGTEFNINAYTDEITTKTTLIEGSARVIYTSRHPELDSGPRNRKEKSYGLNSKAGVLNQVQDDVVLKPNQQALLTNTGNIKVTQVDPDDAIAWKNGLFIFDNETLESAMHKLSVWYDVEVTYEDQKTKDLIVGGSISRFGNISKILYLFEKSGKVKFTIQGRKIKAEGK